MSNTQNPFHLHVSDDPGAAMRKTHHLLMAEKAQTLLGNQSYNQKSLRELFDYEPMTQGFPDLNNLEVGEYNLAGKTLKAPLWISSMTGGTGEARHINQSLARVAREFGLGIGLGSCRQLLHSDEYFEDFNLRPIVGNDICLMANFGMAQMDQWIQNKEHNKIVEICKRLQVDGLFLHINPLQEFFQEEGDRWTRSPLELLDEVLELFEATGLVIGVKEVGQGMGPESIKTIMERPISIFEFGAFGGTNFSKLEKMRGPSSEEFREEIDLRYVGHSAFEMIEFINEWIGHNDQSDLPGIIISGGVRSYLQGHYLLESLKAPAVYGMAMPFLAHAAKGYEELERFVSSELKGLKMAQQFLKVKK